MKNLLFIPLLYSLLIAWPAGTTHTMRIAVNGSRVNETATEFLHQLNLSDSIAKIDSLIDSTKHVAVCLTDRSILKPKNVVYVRGKKFLIYWDGAKHTNANDTFYLCFGLNVDVLNSTATYSNSGINDYWGIDKRSGNTYYDYAGGNNGTGTSVDTTAVHGDGLLFNASGDNVNLGVIPFLHQATKMSYDGMVSFANFDDNRTAFICVSDVENRIYLQCNNTDILINCAVLLCTAPVAGLITTNTLYHLAFTVDLTQTTNAERVKLYINGTQATLTYSGTPPATLGNLSTTQSYLGFTNARTLIGKTDEVSLSSSVYSAGFIADRYRVLFEPSTFYTVGPFEYLGPVITTQPVSDTTTGPVRMFAEYTGDNVQIAWYRLHGTDTTLLSRDSVLQFNATPAMDGDSVIGVLWNITDTVATGKAYIEVVYAVYDSVATSDSLTAYFHGNFLSGSGWTATIGGVSLTTGSGSATAQSFISATKLNVKKKQYKITITNGAYTLIKTFGKGSSVVTTGSGRTSASTGVSPF